jgi:CRISPR-associated endonuclease Cas2
MLRVASLPGEPFAFEGRNRRPPRDPVNCLLSFAYALLAKDCVATLRSVGFDPYYGVLHRPRFGRPALALDLAEEFRAIIADSVVVTAINNGEVRPGHFTVRAKGVALTAEGRKAMLRCHERRLEAEITHPTFGYRISYRRTIEIQARLLGDSMNRERYLVAYDICDPKRLRQVHGIVLGAGSPVQYSVFVCDLTYGELLSLKTALRRVINGGTDSVMFVPLGAGYDSSCFQFMGVTPSLPSGGTTIV